ncbi:hypothetical protein [Streptomyces sp. NPDC059909]|uniref:hypothetical protein n=1 Tax=Streptomyces sp. NPDC059909 TaxID=3346998 RepID=UPI0036530514
MTHRARPQRLLVLTATTALAAAGVLLPTSSFAAPATPQISTVTTTEAGQGVPGHHGTDITPATWAETTDAPSGVTFKLPGKPTVQEIPKSLDGLTPGARVYMAQSAEGIHSAVIVYDVPGSQATLSVGLQEFLRGYNAGSGERLTAGNSRQTTVDGRPALDAPLAAAKGGGKDSGSVRLIADDTHVVQIVTIGPKANEKAVKKTHQQLLAGVRIP